MSAVVLVVTVLVTGGCGNDGSADRADGAGGDDRRPSTAELASSLGTLKDSGSGEPLYSGTQARCIAGVLAASDLSAGSLRLIAKDPAGFGPSDAEAEEFSRIVVRISSCLLDELASPSARP